MSVDVPAITYVAYSYVRFSSIEQLKGDSLRRQTEGAERWASENGYVIKDLSFQDLGKSAYSSSHLEGALGAFLSAIQTGIVKPGDSLLVESLDRLSRDEVLEALSLFTMIIKRGVQIITFSDRKIYNKDNISDIGQLIYSILIMSRAHEESAMKSGRLKKAWEKKRRDAEDKKMTSVSPYWLRLVDNRFEGIEERVALIKRIFDLSLRGNGAESIAKKLNEEQIEPWRGGNGWHKSYILKILRNRAVLGEFQPYSTSFVRQETGRLKKRRCPEGSVIEGYYPAIIDNASFDRVQRALTTRSIVGAGRKGNARNLFTHICKCGSCGGSVNFLNKGSQCYLACDNARRKIGDCVYESWTYEKFERTFLSFVQGLNYNKIFDVNYREETVRLQNELAHLEAEESAKKLKIKKLTDILVLDEAVPDAVLVALKASERELRDIQERIGLKKDAIFNFQKCEDGLDGISWDGLRNADMEDPELRERVRREIRAKVRLIKVYFFSRGPWTKNMPSIEVYFYGPPEREYLIVPSLDDPCRYELLHLTVGDQVLMVEPESWGIGAEPFDESKLDALPSVDLEPTNDAE